MSIMGVREISGVSAEKLREIFFSVFFCESGMGAMVEGYGLKFYFCELVSVEIVEDEGEDGEDKAGDGGGNGLVDASGEYGYGGLSGHFETGKGLLDAEDGSEQTAEGAEIGEIGQPGDTASEVVGDVGEGFLGREFGLIFEERTGSQQQGGGASESFHLKEAVEGQGSEDYGKQEQDEHNGAPTLQEPGQIEQTAIPPGVFSF